ncbi:MAG: hypothetical protein ACJA1C_002358 [Crocinitomicaceae bacterium]|jgi:hypothetical protein
MGSQTDQKVVFRLVRETDLLTTKNRTMQKSEVLEVKLKACRPRFKAGSELSGKVNRITVDIDQVIEAENECLDIDLKWEVTGEGLDCE